MQLNFIDSGNEFDFGKNTRQSLKNPDDILNLKHQIHIEIYRK